MAFVEGGSRVYVHVADEFYGITWVSYVFHYCEGSSMVDKSKGGYI